MPNWHSAFRGGSAAYKRGRAKGKHPFDYAVETGFAMKTLTILSLAAGVALLPTMASAQAVGARGGAGVSWGGGMRAGGGMQMGGGMRPGGGMHMPGGMRPGGGMPGGHAGGGRWQGGSWSGGGQWNGGWGGGVRMPHFRPGQGFPHRLRRGGFIHPFWFGPQFYIQNWQGYGFANPGDDQRWVRYYDDAYLIDRSGRVVDSREGLDWDQYGERWETSDGIPSYYGRNEFQPGDEDYAYVEEQGAERYADARGRHGRDDDEDDDGDRRGRHHRRDRHHGGGEMVAYGAGGAGAGYGGGYAYGGPMPHPGMPMGPGGPGMVYGGGANTTTQVYGGYGGYGMYAYPIVIETTTTTAGGGATYMEEVTEEVIQTRSHRRRAPRCNCSRPRPPAGERG